MRILVIGESCVDIFHYGNCSRLCPEGPVPVFSSLGEVKNGGMAMNVYRNLESFDINVDIKTNENWQDVKKTRFVEKKSNHMFLRVDENDHHFGKVDLSDIDFKKYDAVIVSDYNKGFMSEEDLEFISKQHPLTFLDTKKVLGDWCKNFSFIKINGIEYEKTKHILDDEINKILIVTQGPKGCIFRDKIYKVPLVEVKDVSGAGDTFISAFCFMFVSSNNIDNSINFANDCATKVVQKRGVSVV
jgi:D-beta-D-heptose 7-phosphate kinase/D-beta-D-heptose 1-phosphate adenosyltransferase